MYRVWLRPRLWAGLASSRPASSGAAEPFLSGSSGAYVEQMYEAWTQNPSSVHKARQREEEGWLIMGSWLTSSSVYCVHVVQRASSELN